jgi:hypothetical protein
MENDKMVLDLDDNIGIKYYLITCRNNENIPQ